MPKYTVESPIKFDGRIRAVGETVEMDKAAAEALLELGRLGPTGRARKADAQDPESDAT